METAMNYLPPEEQEFLGGKGKMAGVSGGKGKDGSEKGRELILFLFSPSPLHLKSPHP